MTRLFTSNLALCATLTQAMATRILMKQASSELGQFAYGLDGSEIIIDYPEDGYSTLAQTEQASRTHTCEHVMDYHKQGKDNFYDLVNAGENNLYIDQEFPQNDMLFYADIAGENTSSMASHWDTGRLSSQRVSQHNLFQGSNDCTLFGNKDGRYIVPEDVEQGAIGNCWFMASMTAIAEYPGRIEKSFLNKTISKSGVYGIKMYVMGTPMTITIDDYLPVLDNNRLLYAGIGDDKSLWSALMEKAFAKLHGNYARTVAGDPVDGVSTLNGSPYTRFWTADETEAELWDIITHYKHEERRALLIAGTPCSNGGDDTTNPNGLVNCHAFTILDAQQLTNGTKLIKMRNPWGSEMFVGDYSDLSQDSSRRMTDEVAEELNHQKSNDGTFWMKLEHFKDQVQYVGLNYDTDRWHHASFMKLNDDTSNSVPGSWSFCGSKCARYSAKIRNLSNQPNKVHVGGHTYRSRSFPQTDECASAFYYVDRYHSVYENDAPSVYPWASGERWIPARTFDSNEVVDYTIEIDFDREHAPKDWAFTAWGENGEISIEVIGKESDTWADVKQDHSKLPEDEGKEGGDSTNPNDAKAEENVAAIEHLRDAVLVHQTRALEIMEELKVIQGEIALEHVKNAYDAWQAAKAAKDLAETAYNNARSHFVSNGGEDDPILVDLNKQMEDAEEQLVIAVSQIGYAIAEYEQANYKVQEIYEYRVSELDLLVQMSKQKLDEAEAELNENKGWTETDRQNAALVEAQKAFDATKAAYDSIYGTNQEVGPLTEEVGAHMAILVTYKSDTQLFKDEIVEFISEIQQIIDEYEASNGDEAANAHADACEKYRDNIVDYLAEILLKIEDLKAKLAAIAQHNQIAKDKMQMAMSAKEIAEQKLEEAKDLISSVAVTEDGEEPEDQTLSELQKLYDEAKQQADEAEIAAKAAEAEVKEAEQRKKEITDKIEEIEMKVEMARIDLEKAEENLEKAKNLDETPAQTEAVERAQLAYDEAAQVYGAVMAAKESAVVLCEDADKAIEEANAAADEAWYHKDEADKAVKEIREIKQNYTGDGDCHEQLLMKSNQHYERAMWGHDEVSGAQSAIHEFMEMLDMHKTNLMEAKMNAKALHEDAKGTSSKEELKQIQEAAQAHVDAACAALDGVHAAVDGADGVQNDVIVPTMEEQEGFDQEMDEHHVEILNALDILNAALDANTAAMEKHALAMEIAQQQNEIVDGTANEKMDAEACKKEVEDFLAEIDKLVEEAPTEGDLAAEALLKEAQDQAGIVQVANSMLLSKLSEYTTLYDQIVMYLGETDSMSNMAKLAKEDALNLLDGAVNIIDVDALKDIKQAIEDKAGNATEMADKAETAFGDANDIEELFYETVGKINTFVDEIMEAKMTAHQIYEDAKQYQNTPAQAEDFQETEFMYMSIVQLLELAQEKQTPCNDDSNQLKDDYLFAEGDVSEAKEAADECMYYIEEIQEFIDDASNGGGDGTLLENWLADMPQTDFSNACGSGSVVAEKGGHDLDDGTKGYRFAHNCDDSSKYLEVKISGRNLPSQLKELTYTDASNKCKNRRGVYRCFYKIPVDEDNKLAIAFPVSQGLTVNYAKLK